MSRNYDYKDQELDLKMRIKFLNKKLREPDHGVEQYEEWESNLEMITDELTKVQVKKFKSFLSKWIHVYKKDNQLINVVDCMFVSLEEEEQKDMATKWYHRTIKEKDVRHYQLMAQYTKEENQNLKKRLKAAQKGGDKEINLLRKEIKTKVKQATNQRLLEFRRKEAHFKEQKKEAIKQSKEAMSKNFDNLLRQHVLELNHYKNKHEEQQKIMAAAENADVIKLQAELVALKKSKNKILNDLKECQKLAKENSESETITILGLQQEVILLMEERDRLSKVKEIKL